MTPERTHHLDSGYMLLAAAIVPTPEQAGLVREALTALEDALAPWRTGELIPEHAPPGDSPQDCINESDVVKLCDLKRQVDLLATIIGNDPLP